MSEAHQLPGEGAAGPRFAGTPRFEIIDALGAGGMGVVYRAFDRERNTTVALKTLLTVSPRQLLRLKNEFRALADLHHTNLVSLGELLEHDGHWFFTMELIQGTDFLSYVRPLGAGVPDTSGDTVTAEAFRLNADSAPALTTRVLAATNENAAPTIASGAAFDDSRLRAAFRQLTAGLTALHAAGVVHCDIKPSNVMVTDAGRVVILDFGIAVDTTRAFLGEGGPVGTIAFMAPEQIVSGEIGPEADCYSLGVLLYLALTGQLPFRGTANDILFAKRTMTPLSPSELVPGLPADMEALCMGLLQTEAKARPRTRDILARLGGSADPEVYDQTDVNAFVGRDRELRLLGDHLKAVRRGNCVTAFVHGESGLGKSALVREFLRSAAQRGALVLRGRCYERESVPYKAVDEIMDALSRYLTTVPEQHLAAIVPTDATLLADMFPVLRAVAGIASLPRVNVQDMPSLRRRAFVAVRELLKNLARTRLLVIAIDDLQWTDADSVALLSELLRPDVVWCSPS